MWISVQLAQYRQIIYFDKDRVLGVEDFMLESMLRLVG
jgi:hypothetical protein